MNAKLTHKEDVEGKRDGKRKGLQKNSGNNAWETVWRHVERIAARRRPAPPPHQSQLLLAGWRTVRRSPSAATCWAKGSQAVIAGVRKPTSKVHVMVSFHSGCAQQREDARYKIEAHVPFNAAIRLHKHRKAWTSLLALKSITTERFDGKVVSLKALYLDSRSRRPIVTVRHPCISVRQDERATVLSRSHAVPCSWPMTAWWHRATLKKQE